MHGMLGPESRIFVAGHQGMVGSAIVRKLKHLGYDHLCLKTRSELDLISQAQVQDFFQQESFDIVILAAAKVGGIQANNNYPAEFIYDNLMIQCNVIEAAYSAGINRLLFLGSSCIYPKFAEQPMAESALLTGVLEPTNEPYALAKISGIKLCESYNRQYGTNYRCLMPTNLYGVGDNFHATNSHVVPGLMRRFHEAKLANASQAKVWGSGKARREFLYVDDLASASVFVLQLPDDVYNTHVNPRQSHLNVGVGQDITIFELAKLIQQVVGFEGELVFDPSKFDGTPRKLLDVSVLTQLGWQANVELQRGLELTYQWFLENQYQGLRL